MKKVLVLAAVGLLLASAIAYAQMQHPDGGVAMHHGAMMGSDHSKRPGHMMGQMGPAMMHGGAMSGHDAHDAQPKGDTGPASLAFAGINAKMHKAMNIAYTGNADVDFVKGMIPHHEGAVDMAKTVLAFGKDSQVRKLAEDIIKAQESEIAFMQDWLKKNEK